MKVVVGNRQRSTRVDLAEIRTVAQRAGELSRRLDQKADFAEADLKAIEVCLVSDQCIAKLHGQFLDTPSVTDVITFAHGEIIVSVDTAKRCAAEHGETLEHEICRYIVHGLLHLRGYEDETAAGRTSMWRLQETILRKCSKNR